MAAKHHDSYQQQLKNLVEAKRQGQAVAVTEAPRLAPVIDLMEALRQSLASRPDKKPPSRTGEVNGGTAIEESGERTARRKTAR